MGDERAAPVQELEAARSAYRAGDWERARDALQAAEAAGIDLGPEDLEILGYAEVLLGATSFATMERAYDAYEAAGRVHDAARVAAELANTYGARGSFPHAMGWGRRLERLVEHAPEGPGHAHLAFLHAFLSAMSGRVEDALELVDRAHDIARRHGETDVEARSLNQRARLLVRAGRLDEARADLDEAMLLVRRGRVRPISGAIIYCNTIDVCRDLSDFERAFEWTAAATEWTTANRAWCFPGVCRVHEAELLRLRGEHGRAESVAREAMTLFERLEIPAGIGMALAELGYQRLERDDLDGAEEAFREAYELGEDPLPGIAVVSLRRGDASGAQTTLESALAERGDNPLGRAVLLPALVEARIALDDLAGAREAAVELEETAALIGTVGLRGSASLAMARVHLAAGDAKRAIACARRATRAWSYVGASYELTRAREVLVDAYGAVGDSARAKLEEAALRASRGDPSSAATLAPGNETLASSSTVAREPRPFTAPSIVEGAVIDDRIEVGRILGVGGMGIVHAGRHRLTGRDVAIKILKQRLCGGDRDCARFLQEALACGRIRHPNVVDIYDAGRYGEEPYIVMELLAGAPLTTVLEQRSRLEVGEALTVAEQAARGVAAAHEAGIVHRDLKPGNIFVNDAGGELHTKVLDFGLSKLPDRQHTRPGELMGTPYYMAPEQLGAPSKIDARTDVYALGAVLYETLAGSPPFASDSLPALIYEICHGDGPDLAGALGEVPKPVVDIVGRALARERADRFQSASALADALAEARAAASSPV